jgi:hypothetical protein
VSCCAEIKRTFRRSSETKPEETIRLIFVVNNGPDRLTPGYSQILETSSSAPTWHFPEVEMSGLEGKWTFEVKSIIGPIEDPAVSFVAIRKYHCITQRVAGGRWDLR